MNKFSSQAIMKRKSMFNHFYILFSLSTLFLAQCGAQSNLPSADKVQAETNKETYSVKEYTKTKNLEGYASAIFAGGCFWCTEAAFERINGVVDVISGYSGGEESYPKYYDVGKGKTGHAEAIYIYYDPSVTSYDQLLDVFFIAHDPTTLNRQGPDVGAEYRSAIYYKTDKEKSIIESKIASVNQSKLYADPIVTEVAAYDEFWVAEGYHQNYYELNPNQGYVARVSRPKVKKVLKTFPELIKAKYRNEISK